MELWQIDSFMGCMSKLETLIISVLCTVQSIFIPQVSAFAFFSDPPYLMKTKRNCMVHSGMIIYLFHKPNKMATYDLFIKYYKTKL